ncbi:MAG: SprT-like domain-containing protein [Candidatus Thiodiazotropha sp.]
MKKIEIVFNLYVHVVSMDSGALSHRLIDNPSPFWVHCPCIFWKCRHPSQGLLALMQSDSLQSRVSKKTGELLQIGCERFNLSIEYPEIRFDLNGKTAGMVLFPATGGCIIRYNLPLLAKYGEEFINATVPHEVSHLIARAVYGSRIKPHGIEWKRIMTIFHASPERCHKFDTEQAGGRKLRYFEYRCDCRDHRLSAIRHNRVIQGTVYLCRHCGSRLR